MLDLSTMNGNHHNEVLTNLDVSDSVDHSDVDPLGVISIKSTTQNEDKFMENQNTAIDSTSIPIVPIPLTTETSSSSDSSSSTSISVHVDTSSVNVTSSSNCTPVNTPTSIGHSSPSPSTFFFPRRTSVPKVFRSPGNTRAVDAATHSSRRIPAPPLTGATIHSVYVKPEHH
jgi:hypothetical protein